MKDSPQAELVSGRPTVSAEDAIEHCLQCLFRDSTKTTAEEVVNELSFEELIGALLLAKDLVLQEEIDYDC